MQRMLSLATLAVLGGLAWLFLNEGSTDGPVGPERSDARAVRSPQQSPQTSFPQGNWPPASPNPYPNDAYPRGAYDYGGPPSSSMPENPGVFQPASTNNAWPAAGGPTIRIASYNIEVFGVSKAQNKAVMSTLAEIVRRFDIVAIQEIRTQDDYHIPSFLRWVNATGRQYDHITGIRVGNTRITEQYSFVFDAERIEADFGSHYTIRDPDNLLHREPLVASFRVRGVPADEAFTFTLVNVHTDPHVADDEVDALAEVYRVVRRAGRDEDDVIMLGDFNVDDRSMGRLTKIPGVAPLISGGFSNTVRTRLYDNLVLHGPSTTEYVGRSGVFDVMHEFGLTQNEAAQVSDHFPVWAEFSAYERDIAGRIARRGPNYR